MLSLQAATRTSPGGRSENEDRTAIEQRGDDWVCVLSDGAGGHLGGAIASQVAVERVLEGFRARVSRDPADLRELILDAHDAIATVQRSGSGITSKMHATIVVLAINQVTHHAIWGHVGDSRLYLLRRGKVLAMTRDDSVVQWMVESGYIDSDEARAHPNKNRLLAALGMADEIAPTVAEAATPLEDGDALLLCSDGWWEYLADGDIEATCVQSGTLDEWLDLMAALIVERGKPGQDNYSAIGVWVGDPSERTLLKG